MIDMLSSPLMQRALIVALLVGFTAPVVGTYLVQRGMALMGDGIGHISLTGVAVGWLAAGSLGLSPNDVLAIPGAIVASLIGAILIEVVRAHGRTGGDVALAVDGPLLPTPALKLVVEVYDPARLQATIVKLVSLADAESRAHGRPGAKLVTALKGILLPWSVALAACAGSTVTKV